MMRLIDADGLLEELRESCKWHAENSRELSLLQRDINIVKEQPTVDAIPVIRCKDCKHYEWSDNRAFGYPVKRCEWTGFEDLDDTDYCSRAEGREDGNSKTSDNSDN